MSPLISLFNGIRITMYYSDHNPPHFHASYGDFKCLVDIQGCYILEGYFPKRQLRYILAWCEKHRDELMTDWERCSEGLQPISINGGV